MFGSWPYDPSLHPGTAGAPPVQNPPPPPASLTEDGPENPLYTEAARVSTTAAISAPASPGLLDREIRAQMRHAAMLSTRVYPGPVGKLIQRELYAYEEMGWRFGFAAESEALMRHILELDPDKPQPPTNPPAGPAAAGVAPEEKAA